MNHRILPAFPSSPMKAWCHRRFPTIRNTIVSWTRKRSDALMRNEVADLAPILQEAQARLRLWIG